MSYEHFPVPRSQGEGFFPPELLLALWPPEHDAPVSDAFFRGVLLLLLKLVLFLLFGHYYNL